MMWQRKMTWEEQFEMLGADGIDFHPVFATPPNCEIHNSFTKEEFLKPNCYYPRSGYTFWKKINGYKCYLLMTNER